MPTQPKAQPAKGVLPLKSWSFSRYAIYEECPAAFSFQHVMKLERPAGPAMARGRAVHDEADQFVSSPKKIKLPESLKNFTKEFNMLRKAGALTEADARIGLDKNWEPVDYFDWDNCWLRVVMDAKYSAVVKGTNRLVAIDHKTGKVYEENKLQMELFGTAALQHNKKFDEVEVQLWYLDQGLILPEKPLIYRREDNDKRIKLWNKRIIPMMTDKRFAPKPGNYCRRCHYRKANGGPCKF